MHSLEPKLTVQMNDHAVAWKSNQIKSNLFVTRIHIM